MPDSGVQASTCFIEKKQTQGGQVSWLRLGDCPWGSGFQVSYAPGNTGWREGTNTTVGMRDEWIPSTLCPGSVSPGVPSPTGVLVLLEKGASWKDAKKN